MLANELSQWGLPNSHCAVKGPSPAPLPPLAVSEGDYYSHEDPTLVSAAPATIPVKGLTGTALLCQRALCLLPDAHTALFKGNHLDLVLL